MAHHLTGEGRRGQLTRAATALGCQRSYLSRVLSESMHLTADHAFNLARFLKLNEEERNYFLALVELERAASPEYRQHWQRRLQELRRANDSIRERTKRQALSAEPLNATYFSSYLASAIHFMTAIPELQTSKALMTRLNVKEEIVLLHLEQLQAQNLVEKVRGRWTFKSGEFHLDKSSPLVVLHHQNWRTRAVLDAQDPANESIHFTAVQTMSRETALTIKSLLLNFIAEANRLAGPSPAEDCLALTCDLFQV